MAGLLLAVVLAASPRALPAAPAGQAEAHSVSLSPALPVATSKLFVPFFTYGATYDVAISRVELIQGVTMSDAFTVHIAGRPGLLRVFVTLGGGSSVGGISARVRRFVGGVEQNQLTAGPQTVWATTSEGTLAHTLTSTCLPVG